MTIVDVIERSELTLAGFTGSEIDRLIVYRNAVAAGYYNETPDEPEEPYAHGL